MPKAQRQENSVVSQPPSSGPTAAMPPMVEPHTANAMPRSRPRKVALMIESVVGRIIAPPTPCASRARMRMPPSGALAASTEDAANTITPTTMTLRRPKRSARLPKTSSRAANTSVYDSCTHCTSVDVMPRSSTTAGIAPFTIVESTMISETAMLMKTSPIQRRRSYRFTTTSLAR